MAPGSDDTSDVQPAASAGGMDASQTVEATVESSMTLPEPGQTIQTAVSIEFTPRRTTVLGKADPNRDPNAPEEVVRRRIAASIQQAFERPSGDVAARLQAARTPAEAVQTLKRAGEEGLLGFPPSKAILQALETQDLSTASWEDRRFIRQARIEVAQRIGDVDTVAREATALLEDNPGAFTSTEIAHLESGKAIGLARQGRVEAALQIWRRQLATAEATNAEYRGWLWRNIARTLKLTDPAVKDAARHSADAFLEAGDKFHAISSLAILADAWMHDAPERAFGVMDEMLDIANQEGVHNEELRAGILHNRATRLLAVGSYASALEDAQEAVALRRGLLGVEARLAGSLSLVAAALTGMGRLPEAEGYSEEADRLLDNDGRPYFAVADEISSLFQNFDKALAARIEAEARTQGQWQVVSAVVIATATRDPDLTTEQRLELLEGLLADLDTQEVPGKMTVPARRAIASVLTDAGRYDRAAAWLRRLLEDAPWETGALTELVNAYFKLEDWRSAEKVLRAEVDLRGERPGVLYFLGKAYYQLGDMSAAATALRKSYTLAPDGSDIKGHARELLDKALDAGGTIQPDRPKPQLAPVSREQFEQALDDFAKLIAADQRKGFWRTEDKKRKWIQNPENFGRTLLHTFLKSRFGEQINVFRELDAGAGRLDVLVQLLGGLSIILELKMCGEPYTSAYAAAGEVQILHYMEHRGIHLGYLVVFDGRAKDSGLPLLAPRAADAFTVVEKIVDVRPEVASKANRGTRKK